MKKPAGGRKKPKAHVPHKTGGGAKRKGVRASGAPVPGGRAPAQHHAHHPPGHRMTNPLVPAPHHHRRVKSKQPVKRKLALGEGVACCAAEALAASLRLAGVPVGDEDVLALYWRTAADADAGATISATLEAAQRFGLAGVRPVVVAPACAAAPVLGVIFPLDLERAVGMDGTVPVIDGAEEDPVIAAAPGDHPLDRHAGLAGVPAGALLGDCLPGHECLPVSSGGPGLPWSDSNRRGPDATSPSTGAGATPGRTRCGLFGYASKPGLSSVLLGVTLPGGPHALCSDPSGAVWSWGELHDLPGLGPGTIDEAWAVSWA